MRALRFIRDYWVYWSAALLVGLVGGHMSVLYGWAAAAPFMVGGWLFLTYTFLIRGRSS